MDCIPSTSSMPTTPRNRSYHDKSFPGQENGLILETPQCLNLRFSIPIPFTSIVKRNRGPMTSTPANKSSNSNVVGRNPPPTRLHRGPGPPPEPQLLPANHQPHWARRRGMVVVCCNLAEAFGNEFPAKTPRNEFNCVSLSFLPGFVMRSPS